MHELDFSPDGLRWIDADDSDDSVLSYMRYGKDGVGPLVIVLNFTPVPRRGYRIGAPSVKPVLSLASATASVCRKPDTGRKFLTATPRSTVAPTKATTAASIRNRARTTATRNRWC